MLSILAVIRMTRAKAGRGLITNITTVHDKLTPAVALTPVACRLVLTISRVKSRALALTQLSHLICSL